MPNYPSKDTKHDNLILPVSVAESVSHTVCCLFCIVFWPFGETFLRWNPVNPVMLVWFKHHVAHSLALWDDVVLQVNQFAETIEDHIPIGYQPALGSWNDLYLRTLANRLLVQSMHARWCSIDAHWFRFIWFSMCWNKILCTVSIFSSSVERVPHNLFDNQSRLHLII